MIKVAFICIHNSCRSQMAEALGKKLASKVFESFSAGTEKKDKINPDAVRIMKKIYGIDMELTQYPKTLAEIPRVDIVITMGCGIECPYFPSRFREDWGLADPTGQSDRVFEDLCKVIETKIVDLKDRIQNHLL